MPRCWQHDPAPCTAHHHALPHTIPSAHPTHPNPCPQVKEVSENPLAALTPARRGSGPLAGVGEEKRDRRGRTPKPLETQVLESSIHKICSLLSVGCCGDGAGRVGQSRDVTAHVPAAAFAG